MFSEKIFNAICIYHNFSRKSYTFNFPKGSFMINCKVVSLLLFLFD